MRNGVFVYASPPVDYEDEYIRPMIDVSILPLQAVPDNKLESTIEHVPNDMLKTFFDFIKAEKDKLSKENMELQNFINDKTEKMNANSNMIGLYNTMIDSIQKINGIVNK